MSVLNDNPNIQEMQSKRHSASMNLSLYRSLIKKYPQLTKEEEIELGKIIKKHPNTSEGQNAKNKFVLSNIKLAVKVASDVYYGVSIVTA